jgi:hypothetical protein
MTDGRQRGVRKINRENDLEHRESFAALFLHNGMLNGAGEGNRTLVSRKSLQHLTTNDLRIFVRMVQSSGLSPFLFCSLPNTRPSANVLSELIY